MVSGNWGLNCYGEQIVWVCKYLSPQNNNNKTKKPWFSAWCSVAFPCFQHSFFLINLSTDQFIILNLQLEEGFLSQEERKATLPSILKEIFDELNKNGKCMIQIGEFAYNVSFEWHSPGCKQHFSKLACLLPQLTSSTILVNSQLVVSDQLGFLILFLW